MNDELTPTGERLAAQPLSGEPSPPKPADPRLCYQFALLQHVSDAIIATDLELRITSWNQAATDIYGWTAAEVMGQPVDELLKSEFLDETQVQAQAILAETGRWQGNLRQWTKEGRRLEVEAVVSWLKDAGGRIIGGVTVNRDITRRKQAEQALRESEQRFRIVATSTLDIIYQWDVGDNSLQWFGDIRSLFGDSTSSLPDTIDQWLQLIHPADRDMVIKLAKQGLAAQQPWRGEYRLRLPDQTIKYLYGSGTAVYDQRRPIKVFGSIVDISKNKEAEQALRSRQLQYQLLAEHVADGIGIVQHERFVFVNQALCRLFEMPEPHLLATPPIALFHEAYHEHFTEMLLQAEKGGFQQNELAVCLGGAERTREFWIEGCYSQIEWEGRPAVILTMRDITSRKQRECELEAEKNRLQSANIRLRSTLQDRYRLGDIIGKSAAMQEVYELVLKAAASDASVILCGESGTGKELIAWTIHTLSPRHEHAFIPVNCSAIPETLFESHFFGHRKGAFTGADKDKAGFFDHTHGGTLFLDEVAELTPTMQAKLLRALAGGGHTPLGDHRVKTPDVRIIAATNRNLREMVMQGALREDFYYRITVIPMTLPPLRDRREDIPLLIEHFLRQLSQTQPPPVLPGIILHELYTYDWPGNVRELQNALQRYLTTGHLDFIAPPRPPAQQPDSPLHLPPSASPAQGNDFHATIRAFEKQVVRQALEQHRWQRTRTAAALGISRRSLFRLIKKHGLLDKTR